MPRRLFTAALVAALSSLGAHAQSGCTNIDGNYYCASTNAIIYNNVGFAGSYSEITNMDSSSCACSSSPFSFSGPLAPLNNEVFSYPTHPVDMYRSQFISGDPSTLVRLLFTINQVPPNKNEQQNRSQSRNQSRNQNPSMLFTDAGFLVSVTKNVTNIVMTNVISSL